MISRTFGSVLAYTWAWLRNNGDVLLTGIVLALAVVRWKVPGSMLAQVDTPPLFDPLHIAAKTFWPANHYVFALGTAPYVLLLLYCIVVGLLAKLIEPWNAQVFYMWSAAFIAYLGARSLAKEMGLQGLSSRVAAWLTVFNPFMLMFTFYSITGAMDVAVIPWLLWMVARASRVPRARPWIEVALVLCSSLIFSQLAVSPPFLFADIIIVSSYAVAEYARLSSIARPSFARWLGSVAVWSMVASLWWLIPDAWGVAHAKLTRTTDIAGLTWVFRHADLLDDFRMVSTWAWGTPDVLPYSQYYDARPLWYFSCFVPIVLASAGIWIKPRLTSRELYFLLLVIAGIFATKGLHEPFASVNAFLYHLPLLVLLIEPLGFTVGDVLAIALLAGRGLKAVNRQLSLPAVLGSTAIVVVASLYSSWPLVDGEIAHNATSYAPPWHVRVPAYWADAGRYVGERDRSGIVYVLPANQFSQAFYDWGYLGVDSIPEEMMPNRVFNAGAPLTYLEDPRQVELDSSIRELFLSNPHSAVALLRSYGIRFVLLRGDVRSVIPSVDDSLWAVKNALHGYPTTKFGPLTIVDLGQKTLPRYLFVQARSPKDIQVISEGHTEQCNCRSAKLLDRSSVSIVLHGLRRPQPIAPPIISEGFPNIVSPDEMEVTMLNFAPHLAATNLCFALPVIKDGIATASAMGATYSWKAEHSGMQPVCFPKVVLWPGRTIVRVRWHLDVDRTHYETPGQRLRVGDVWVPQSEKSSGNAGPADHESSYDATWLIARRTVDGDVTRGIGSLQFPRYMEIGMPTCCYLLGYVAEIQNVNSRRWCWTAVNQWFPVDLSRSVLYCFGNPVKTLDHLGQYKVKAIGVAVYGTRADAYSALEWLCRQATLRLSSSSPVPQLVPPRVPGSLGRRSIVGLHYRDLFLGLLTIIRVPQGKEGILVTDDLSSNDRVLVSLRGLKVQRALPMGLMQGFLVDGSSSIYVYFDVFNLATAILQVVAIAACVALIRGALRSSEPPEGSPSPVS